MGGVCEEGMGYMYTLPTDVDASLPTTCSLVTLETLHWIRREGGAP